MAIAGVGVAVGVGLWNTAHGSEEQEMATGGAAAGVALLVGMAVCVGVLVAVSAVLGVDVLVAGRV